MPKILVAGIGNKYMGDDGFGPRVVDALLNHLSSANSDTNADVNVDADVDVRDVGLCGVTLAPDLADYSLVMFLDAVQRGGSPGTLYRAEIKAEDVSIWNENAKEEAILSPISIHETRLEEILRFAKAIGTLPEKVIFIGCEIKEVKLGEEMSEEVENAVKKAVNIVLEEISRYISSECSRVNEMKLKNE